jgi:hypothetical protein
VCCIVAASCNFISAKNMARNVTVKLELLGTPRPQFTAVHPWHLVSSHTTGYVEATRLRGFDESSPQLIGNLTQVVSKARERVSEPCSPQISKHRDGKYAAIHLSRLKVCLLIRFAPKDDFCDQQSSFNTQVFL